eukprot:TRINITY_DN9489_c0_g1_i1.p1 TRINITY_DN9489_c0_g1~~TRINITY_DN9489_c0_g1_i1.p1  ORF type:complete len:309 (-),score=22.76 TRINITY_DN9489_c0_g1_i1:309-1235(-)
MSASGFRPLPSQSQGPRIPAWTDKYVKDSRDFAGLVAAQYYNVTTSAVRAVDPYHLILGSKFAFSPVQSVTSACGQYCDVISWNYYTNNYYAPRASDIHSLSQWGHNKPVLISEYGIRAYDTQSSRDSASDKAGPVFPTQAERAQDWKSYATTLAALKEIVGLHWFMFHDMPTSSTPKTGPSATNGNYGLVNATDAIYTAVTSEMTKVNPTLANLHEAHPTNLTAFCKIALKCYTKCGIHGCCDSSVGSCKCDDGYGGVDCSEDHASFSLSTFTAPLSRSVWTVGDGYGYTQEYFQAARTNVSKASYH